MDKLSKEDMLSHFKEINSRLESMNRTGEIFVIGGAAISLAFGGRDATEDIDAECLLAMKLASARPDTSPDMDDCLLLMERLGINEEKELHNLVELYTDEKSRDPAYRYFVTEAHIQYYQRRIEEGQKGI